MNKKQLVNFSYFTMALHRTS